MPSFPHYIRADIAAEQVREAREAILDAIASIPHPDDLGEAEGLEKAYRAAEVAADMPAESGRSIKAMVERHLHDIVNGGTCAGSRHSARLALAACKGVRDE